MWIKTNGLIALIAMGIVALAVGLGAWRQGDKGKAVRCLVIILLLILLPWGARAWTNGYYEARSGREIPEGVPAAAYIAMGLSETDGKFGWYNGENVRFYKDQGGDADAASKAAWQVARERMSVYMRDAKSFLHFFGMKFLSQWGDPTRVSLREQELTARHQGELSPWAEGLTFGMGYRIIQWWMRFYQLLIHFLAGVELLRLFGKKGRIDHGTGLLLLFIFGGMLFHELWEASGRYTLRYALALLPLAAAGAIHLFSLRRQHGG